MRLLVIAALVVAVSAIAPLSDEEYQSQFLDYIRTYNKAYSTDVFFGKYNTFKANLDSIRQHNSENHGWTKGMNQFGDMNSADWKNFIKAFPLTGRPQATGTFKPKADPPTSWDWKDKGAVNPVKNQASCGSCWAFSTTGAVEGWWFINGPTKKLENLSEQQLVDCSKDTCYGCQGGWPYKAVEYVMKSGICNQASYPYKGVDQTCKASSCTPTIPAGALTGYLNVSGEAGLVAAIYTGPVSVLVEADQSVFQFYRSGVVSSPACGTQIDHAILATGYGTQGAQDYYNVKNSWGASWGDNGYIRILRGKNICGINQGPVLPGSQ